MIRALEDLPIREQYTYMDMRTIFVKNGIYAGEVTAKKMSLQKDFREKTQVNIFNNNSISHIY